MADISQVTLPDNNTYDIKAKELASQSKTISNVAIASFSDGADNVPVSELIVDINAVQDLHGQASPYPAGGSAQRWDEEWELGYYSVSDGSFGSRNDGICSKQNKPILVIPNTTYSIRVPYNTILANAILFYDKNDNYIDWVRVDTGGSILSGTFTTPNNAYYVRFYLNKAYGTTYNNDISINYPATDTSYHPYSNNCPISGWNGCVITRCGTNIWDGDFESGKFNISTGAEVSDSNFIRSKNFIKVKPDTVGYVKFDNPQFIALFYDENKTYTTHYSALGSGGGYISIPSDAHYMKFYSQESTNQNDISINYPTETDEDYHAYVGSKYQTYFEGLMAGTYGFVDLGSLNWTLYSGNRWVSNLITGMKPNASNYRLSGYICDRFSEVTADQLATNTTLIGFSINTVGNIAVRTGDENTPTGTVVYELATPTTPTITQEQINMLISAFNANLVCVVFGQEVYGGSLNFTTGVIKINKACLRVDDFTFSNQVSGGGLHWADYNDTNIDINGVSYCSLYPKAISANTGWWSRTPVYNIEEQGGNKRVRVYTDKTTVEEFRATTELQVVFSLANQITVQLTPTEVRTLLNNNNIFADTGDINKLVYFKTGCESITDIINVMHDDSKMSYSNAYGKKTCNQLTDPGIYYNIDTTGSPAEGYSMTTLITTYNCQILVYLGLVVNTRRVNHAPGGTITFSPWKRLANEDDLDGAVIPYNAEYSTTNTVYDEIEALKSPTVQTVTLAANSWNSSTHLITVNVTDVTATSVQDVIGLPATSSANISNNEALQNANIMDAGQSSGTLTFYAETVPTTDLQVRVIVRG